MKKFFLLLVIVAQIALLVPGCAEEKDNKLKVGYIPIAECAPLYVAQELHLFEKHGVQVEFVSMSGGALILGALRGGTVDVGFSNVVSLVLQRSNGADFQSIFGATFETSSHRNHALLAVDEHGVAPTELLSSATIAVNTRKNIEELMVRRYADSIGIPTIGDEQFLEVPFPQMLPLLEAGKVTVASIVEPFITISSNGDGPEKQLCNHYLSTRERSLVATYVSSENIVSRKGELISRFIAAMAEATEIVNSREGKAREVVGLYTKIPATLLSQIGMSEFRNEMTEDDLAPVVNDMIKYGFLADSESVTDLSDIIYKVKE